MNQYKLSDLLIKPIYSTCFFTQSLSHLTLEALLPVYPESTITSNVNYALALATSLNSFNHLMSTRLHLVFPLSYCKHVLMKFNLCYVDYSICP